MATPITLNLRQEVLATSSTYVSVNEVTGVGGLIGTAALGAAAAFTFAHQDSGAELLTGVVSAGSLQTIPVASAFDLQLEAGKFNPLLLPQVTRVQATIPSYWETEHYATITYTGSAGEILLSGVEWQLRDLVYNAFTSADVGSKIRISSGNNAGVYKITKLVSPSIVALATNTPLTAAPTQPWELLEFPSLAAATFSDAGLSTSLGLALPATLADPLNDTMLVDLLDASTVVQANVPVKPVRTSLGSVARSNVIYSYTSSAEAASNINLEMATLLAVYVTSLNTVQSFAGSHAVTTSIITGS